MNDDIVLLSTNTETKDKVRIVISEYVIADTAASLQRNLTP